MISTVITLNSIYTTNSLYLGVIKMLTKGSHCYFFAVLC